MPDNPKGPDQGGHATAAPSPEQVAAFIASTSDSIKRLEKMLGDQRAYHDSRYQLLQRQLQAAQSYQRTQTTTDDEDGEERPRVRSADPRSEAKRLRSQMLEFKMEHPEYLTGNLVGADGKPVSLREKVDSLVNDQVWASRNVVYDDEGLIDYARTYERALDHAQLSIYKERETAQRAAEADKSNQTARRSALAEAALSGEGAEEIPEGFDLDSLADMSAEDMEKAGLVGPMRPKRKAAVGVVR